jgi:tetratricopeptide (TPR) repeat protein
MDGRRSSKKAVIEGDVNIKNGDLVGGDKAVIQGDGKETSLSELSAGTCKKKAKGQVVGGNLDVRDGDVVFGDKIVKFIQDKLNIYLFKDLKQLAFFLAALLLFSGGITVGVWYSRQPKKMVGDYNIAVAQFGEIRADGTIASSSRATKIQETLFNFLDSEYRATNPGLVVQTSYKNIPLITENSQAEQLAKTINADVVIYGTIYVNGDRAEFSPRFYVAEYPDTSELTGQNELALPIEFAISELGAQDQVNRELRKRTEVLFNFTRALIFVSQKDWDSGLMAIDAAIASANKSSKTFEGEEALYLLAAIIRSARGESEAANQMLDQALVINPQYARAHLARGNILYSQAIDENFDDELLARAQSEYLTALNMPSQPEGANIPIKARTALGNVLVIKAQKTNDASLFAESVENYTYVINQYEKRKDPFLGQFASIAYFGLGVAYERQGDAEQAVVAYQKSLSLTEDETFQDRIKEQLIVVSGTADSVAVVGFAATPTLTSTSTSYVMSTSIVDTIPTATFRQSACLKLIYPTDGATLLNPSKENFSWNARPDAQFYSLTFIYPDGSHVNFQTRVTNYTPLLSKARKGEAFIWFVTAHNPGGDQICSSAVFVFTIFDSGAINASMTPVAPPAPTPSQPPVASPTPTPIQTPVVPPSPPATFPPPPP